MRWGLGLLAAVAAWGLVTTSTARGDDKPILMLDTGGHQALIRATAFTPDGKYLVSAGNDKVVRVWDWRAGKTVRTIRGQVGPGLEGQILAAALSPDGRWLAAGGFMAPGYGVRDEDVGDIRLYDFATGELTALLKGQTNSTFALAFSPDGKRLISGSFDHSAIIWDVAAHRPLNRLQGHTAEIYGVGFTPDGARAVTASDDQTLRLWNVADGSLIKDMPGHGDKVRALAVSPKDGTIASGDYSGEIRLWNGKTGAFVRTLAQQGGNARSLRFSDDGRLLLSTCGGAGCGLKQRIFDVASSQELTVYSELDDIVVASAFTPDGRLVATGGGSNQEIRIWDLRTGETKAVLKGTGRPAWAAGFSADGRQIAWGHTIKQESLVDRGPLEMAVRLPGVGETLGEPKPVANQEGWVRAHTRFGAWLLQHRKGGAYGFDGILDILQDGKVQARIERDGTSGYQHRAYGFTPDGETVISGGDGGFLTAYRLDGTKIGDFIGHEGEVWAVAASPNGKYLVSGSADQTVRLWNLQTRELLVSLFYGTDGEWVMWTPEGFFTGSLHGAERVGWQINQGSDKEARYVAGDQLRKAFFRPDLVVEKIAGDPDGKVREAAAELKIEKVLAGGIAPDVSVLSPVEGAQAENVSITVRARVTDKGGGVGRIIWKVNGQRVGSSLGLLDAKGEITRSFDLDAAENTIEVVAANKSGLVESKPARVSVKVDARALRGDPDLYILAVGVNDYNDVKYKLHFAVSDAKDLSDTLVDAGSGFYRHKPQVVMLGDGEVTAENLSAKFKELGAKIKANDVFLFFIAGHGKTISGDYYFVPRGIDAFTNDAIRKQGFGPQQWQEWFENIKAQKSIFIFDTCESGAADRMFRGEAEDDAAYRRLNEATGRVIFMAASDQQTAAEGFRGHGILTYTILEGLALAGNPNNNKINVDALREYVYNMVPQYSRELKACTVVRQQEYCQKPRVSVQSRDYPLVPRYPQILTKLGATGEVISRKPTHFVIATADLLEQAARGSPVTRQLPAGTMVTVIEPIEGGWAHVAQEGKAIGYVQEERLVKILQ